MLNTNQTTKFGAIVERELGKATAVDIAVGYCGISAVAWATPKLLSIAKKGRVRLILGMYRIDGSLGQNLRAKLLALHDEIVSLPARRADSSGVYITTEDYHGKIWCFEHGIAKTVWLGSNNFPMEGLNTRLEAGTRISDSKDIQEIETYIDCLCNPMRSISIEMLRPSKRTVKKLSSLPRVHELPAEPEPGASMELQLRPSEQQRSCLNLCFGSGRRNLQGLYTPRPWYEVELSNSIEEISNPVYPKPRPEDIPAGKKTLRVEFVAYLTHDGHSYWKTTLSTYSDRNKALGSDPRTILGEFLKGGLEEAGVLRKGEPVTDEVLDAYGRDAVTLTRLKNGEYVVFF